MAETNANVVPIGADHPKQFITQKHMREYAELEQNLKILQRRYDEAKEAMIFALVDKNTTQEEGMLKAVLKVSERRYPSWKKEYTKLAGEAQADYLIDITEPTIVRQVEIVIGASVK